MRLKKKVLFLFCVPIILFCVQCAEPEISPEKKEVNESTDFLQKEAPMLAQQVAAGAIPPLKDRLPVNPKIIVPRDSLGHYCDTWHYATVGAGNLGGIHPRILYVSLLHFAQDWNSIESGLADKWTISPDGRVFTFHLRDGVKWSDGKAFTARDIEFYFKYVFGNKKIIPVLPAYLVQDGQPAKLEIIDDLTFRFSFPKANGIFELAIANQSHEFLKPAHYLKKFIPPFVSEEVADSIATANGFSGWTAFFTSVVKQPFLNHDLPVLCAWILTTPLTKSVTRWVYERNPFYYAVDTLGRQLPYFDYFEIANLTDKEQLYLKVISGEIDCQGRHLNGDRAQFLAVNQERGGYKIHFFPQEVVLGLHFNQTHAGDPVLRQLFQDRRFRLAMSYGINRTEIHKLLNMGQKDDMQNILIPPEFSADVAITEWFDYDPQKANEMLDQLGLIRNSDGWRLRPDGDQLVLTAHIIEFLSIDWVELVQEYWGDLGIKLNIQKHSYRGWWDFLTAFDFDVIAYYVDMTPTRHLLLSAYHILPFHANTHWGGQWGLWYSSDGKAGERPPEHMMPLIDQWEEITQTANSEKQQHKINHIVADALRMGNALPVKKLMPGINVQKNNFYNVGHANYPRGSSVLNGPGPDYPETYWMD